MIENLQLTVYNENINLLCVCREVQHKRMINSDLSSCFLDALSYNIVGAIHESPAITVGFLRAIRESPLQYIEKASQ